MMRRIVTLALAALTFSAPSHAAIFTLNYTGSGTINTHSGPINVQETGTGSFEVNIDNGTATLGNGLTMFTFTVTSKESTCCAASNTYTYDFGFSALNSFSATIANGQVASFSFNAGSTQNRFAASNGYTNRSGNGFGIGGTITAARAAAGPVPEPSSWALMLGGFGIVGSALRRRGVMSHWAA